MIGENEFNDDDIAYIKRMCEIILGNNFGNAELDSFALWISHHPAIMAADSSTIYKGV